MTTPKQQQTETIPKPNFERLEAEVKRLRESKEKEEAYKIEKAKKQSEPQDIADIMPDIIASLERAKEQAAKYRDEIKAQADSLPLRECPVHDGEECRIDLEKTIETSRIRNTFAPRYLKCEICKQIDLVNERHKKWISMGVPLKVAHASFDNFEATTKQMQDALQKVKTQFFRNSGFLILLGKCGTGKSHLAASVLKQVGSGIFVTHDELIDGLRATYDGGGKNKLVDKMRKAECLVIDEIVPTLKGDDIPAFMYSILGYRFDRDLITVLTSNEDVAGLKTILGEKLNDRMANNYTAATFTWESHRRTHKEI